MTLLNVAIHVEAGSLLKTIDDAIDATSNESMWNFLERKVHPYLGKRIDDRFASEGDDATGKWEKLAFNTGRIRASKGFPAWHPINKRTGDLHRFVRDTYRLQGGDDVTLTLPDGGSREERRKLAVAQLGGAVASGKGNFRGPNRPAPPRPVLALNARDAYVIQKDLMSLIRIGVST